MKTLLCIALLLTVVQASSILEVLKRLLEEEEIEQRGVYKVSKTSTTITGTILMNVKDCEAPERGCRYEIKAKNTQSPYDEKTEVVYTSDKAATFYFGGLNQQGNYAVTGCISLINGLESCGPKMVMCDMSTPAASCKSVALTKKSDLETRGVSNLKVDQDSISGRIQIDTADCSGPPYNNCPYYTVKCLNAEGKGQVRNPQDFGKGSDFKCTGLNPGIYTVSACQSGKSKCGPRVAKCTVPNGPCTLERANSII